MPRMSKDVIYTVKEGTVDIRNEVTTKISGYMIGGLGVVAGLAWNDAIKTLIEYLFPLAKNTIVAQFIYALVISIIVIIASVLIMKATKKVIINKDDDANKKQ